MIPATSAFATRNHQRALGHGTETTSEPSAFPPYETRFGTCRVHTAAERGVCPIGATHTIRRAVNHRPEGVIEAMDLDLRKRPRGLRALCVPAVIGVLLTLGGCGSGGDSLPSRTASAELPAVSLSIDRTEPASSTTVEPPATESTPARTPIVGQTDTSEETNPPVAENTSRETRTPPSLSTQPATTEVTQTTQVTQTAQVTQTEEVTRTQQTTETAETTQTTQFTETSTTTPFSAPAETVTLTPTTSMASAQPTSTTTGPPAWPWWLLGAALIAVAIAVPLLLAARRRRNSWTAQLMTATGEIVWYARQLIPQLQEAGSRDQLAGAWQVTRDRVSALEDTLTGLQSTASDEPEAARARGLRDAVRDARTRIDAAADTARPPVDTATTRYALGEVRATLETALANSEPGHNPVDDDLEP